jgi:Tfp pilus assembly protein PilO
MARESQKRVQINKSNSMVVIIIALASFTIVFSLLASKALLSQWAFQGRVIKEKQKAVDQLKSNIAATDTLLASYETFAGAPVNIIGGSKDGTGPRDGDNARLVLDSLPSEYDFPALVTSLEKLLDGYAINGIQGSDDALNQLGEAQTTPAPVDMPFTISVAGSYDKLSTLIKTLESSIRPIQIQKLNFSGSDAEVQLTIDAKTFYQPAKSLKIEKKDVK